MDVQNIEKLKQLISRTDINGIEKVEWLISFIENYQVTQSNCEHNFIGINQNQSYCSKCKITVED
jgi:hypothetical protein